MRPARASKESNFDFMRERSSVLSTVVASMSQECVCDCAETRQIAGQRMKAENMQCSQLLRSNRGTFCDVIVRCRAKRLRTIKQLSQRGEAAGQPPRPTETCNCNKNSSLLEDSINRKRPRRGPRDPYEKCYN